MPNVEESLSFDSSNISPHFFSDSKSYLDLKKYKQKPYRYFYNLTTPRSKRKAFEKQADITQQNQVAFNWEKLIELYFKGSLERFYLKPKKTFNNEKIIWQYWGQGIDDAVLPDTVKLCFKSVDKHCQDYKIIRLDDNNIGYYLDLPSFVWDKKKAPGFRPAFFADLLRLALLDVYGGIWLDATIYLSGPLPNFLNDNDFFMYQRSSDAPNKQQWVDFNKSYFSWEKEHKINVLNSAIFAIKGNTVIHTCLDLILNFWKTQEYIPHYFFFQILFDTLIKYRFKKYQCCIIDDTRPHLLAIELHKQFNEQKFNEIISQSSLHKLSYTQQPKPHSFYDYLTKNS